MCAGAQRTKAYSWILGGAIIELYITLDMKNFSGNCSTAPLPLAPARGMLRFATLAFLLLLLSCRSTPKLEDDVRYVKLAVVTGKHVFTELERKQANTKESGNSKVGFGFGVGSRGGFSGGFGGIMLGMGDQHDSSKQPPQVAKGANRYTVQPLSSELFVEVMSYDQYQVGDCVRVLAGHPSEYPRFFKLKAGEHCNPKPDGAGTKPLPASP